MTETKEIMILKTPIIKNKKSYEYRIAIIDTGLDFITMIMHFINAPVLKTKSKAQEKAKDMRARLGHNIVKIKELELPFNSYIDVNKEDIEQVPELKEEPKKTFCNKGTNITNIDHLPFY